MKKIKYIIIGAKKEKINKETLESLVALTGKADLQTVFIQVSDKEKEETLINEEISKIEEEIEYICIVKNGSIFKNTFAKTVEDYIINPNVVYLPLVEYHGVSGETTGFKGFLNSSLWKPYFTENIGELDLKLSKRGVDLTIYGAIIPVNILKNNKFKSTIPYYSYFEWFNRIINKGVTVVGIPRVVVKSMFDYELQSLSKEDKIAFFKQAQEDYVNEV
jgi:hypothetical protein